MSGSVPTVGAVDETGFAVADFEGDEGGSLENESEVFVPVGWGLFSGRKSFRERGKNEEWR